VLSTVSVLALGGHWPLCRLFGWLLELPACKPGLLKLFLLLLVWFLVHGVIIVFYDMAVLKFTKIFKDIH